jgi:hypothetical protein
MVEGDGAEVHAGFDETVRDLELNAGNSCTAVMPNRMRHDVREVMINEGRWGLLHDLERFDCGRTSEALRPPDHTEAGVSLLEQTRASSGCCRDDEILKRIVQTE